MTTAIVKNEEINFLLKCLKKGSVGFSGNTLQVDLEFPVGFEPDFERMKEFFQYFTSEVNMNYKHQIFHSVNGTVKNKEMKDIFTSYLFRNP